MILNWRTIVYRFLVVLIPNHVYAINNQHEREIINELFQGYDKSIRPESPNGTKVEVNVYLRHISAINSKDMEMTSQITFRQRWNDPRLNFQNKNGKSVVQRFAKGGVRKGGIKLISLPSKDMVWKPDTFFRNEIWSKVHQDLQSNDYMRLYPNGDLQYSVRLTLKTTCAMDLLNFPFDSQECRMQIASYGQWKTMVDYAWSKKSPVQTGSNLSLPDGFRLASISNDRCDVRTLTGSYSCLNLSIGIERYPWPAIKACCLPLAGLVLLSLASMWVPIKTEVYLVARLLLGCAFGLAASLVSMFGYGSPTPYTAYSTAIDKWKVFCCIVTWLAFIQTIVMYYLSEMGKKSNQGNNLEEIENFGGEKELAESNHSSVWIRNAKKALMSEWFFRIIFPLTFLLYAISYFSYYLST